MVILKKNRFRSAFFFLLVLLAGPSAASANGEKAADTHEKPSKAETAAYIARMYPKKLDFLSKDFIEISATFHEDNPCLMDVSYKENAELTTFSINFETVNTVAFTNGTITEHSYIRIDDRKLPFMVSYYPEKSQLGKAFLHLHKLCAPPLFE